MLLTHINEIENTLLQISKIPANAGHTLHRGTPRETFIRQFLQNHLSELIGFGTGEIIDCNSHPRQQRNQIDILLYKKNYPKLNFGGEVHGFFAESVVSTIEVKSILTEQELISSLNSIRNTKSLHRNVVTSFHTGYHPPGILSFIVAYDGPQNMSTIHGWINNYIRNNGIAMPTLPATGNERQQISCPLADVIVVLGKGVIQYDNSPVSFINDTNRQQNPNGNWLVIDNTTGNLLLLFSQLTIALSGVSANWMDMMPYLRNFNIPNGAGRFMN